MRSLTRPFSVNLIAFDSRLRSTWRSRMSSVSMRRRQVLVELDAERQALLLGDLAERLVDVVAQVREPHLTDLDGHRAGLDLREVEDLVDQGHQIGTGLADRLGVADLLVAEVAARRCRRAGATG